VNDTAKGMPLPKANVVMWNPGEKEPTTTKDASQKGFLLSTQKYSLRGNQSKLNFAIFLILRRRRCSLPKSRHLPADKSSCEQMRRTAELLFNTDGEYRAILKDFQEDPSERAESMAGCATSQP